MSAGDQTLGEQWPPQRPPDNKFECDRDCCDNIVSPEFYRMWSDNDGKLRGCRKCLPRSIRFGEDVYDRDPEEITDFDPEAPNRGRDPAPSSRLKDDLEESEDGDTADRDEDNGTDTSLSTDDDQELAEDEVRPVPQPSK